jgi:hypothetical protein
LEAGDSAGPPCPCPHFPLRVVLPWLPVPRAVAVVAALTLWFSSTTVGFVACWLQLEGEFGQVAGAFEQLWEVVKMMGRQPSTRHVVVARNDVALIVGT